MTIIAKIYTGYKIKTENDDMKVIGSMKSRSGYKYICHNSKGEKVCVDRNDLLAAQKNGEATVYM